MDVCTMSMGLAMTGFQSYGKYQALWAMIE